MDQHVNLWLFKGGGYRVSHTAREDAWECGGRFQSMILGGENTVSAPDTSVTGGAKGIGAYNSWPRLIRMSLTCRKVRSTGGCGLTMPSCSYMAKLTLEQSWVEYSMNRITCSILFRQGSGTIRES